LLLIFAVSAPERPDTIASEMTDIEMLEGQGLARIFRETLTDAWKVPSVTLIRQNACTIVSRMH